MMLKTLLLWTAVGVAGVAQAAPNLVRHADLDLVTARQLADAALKHCTGALSVLDRGGNVLMSMRPESVGPHNLLASQRKAYTALSTKTPTRLFAERARSKCRAFQRGALPRAGATGRRTVGKCASDGTQPCQPAFQAAGLAGCRCNAAL